MRKKRIIAISAVLLVLAVIIAAALKIYVPMLKMAGEPEEFRMFLESKGFWGMIIFILITTVQVIIAVIPGGPLEIAAGYCFGPFKGALICDLGMTMGSITVFLLVRRFGMSFIELFISKEKISSLKFLKTNGQSRLVIFLLFLIPGTPKDVLAYGVGLTDLSLLSWILITSVGRFPSIIFSTMGGNALIEGQYIQFIIIICLIIVLAVVGGILYKRWLKKRDEKER